MTVTAGRRVAFVRVSPNLLESMLGGGLERVASDAPKDLEVVGCDWDFFAQTARVYCESASFKLLAEGEPAQEFSVWFHRAWCPDPVCGAEMEPLCADGRTVGWACPVDHGTKATQ